MKPSGFWRRTLGYLFDIIPIVILTFLVFYFFLGFNETEQKMLIWLDRRYNFL